MTDNFPEDSYPDREFSRRFLSWPRIFQKIPIMTENFPEDSYHDREFSRRFLSWPRIFQKIPIVTENFPEDSYRDREFSRRFLSWPRIFQKIPIMTENFPEDSYHDREFSRRFLSWPRIFQKIPIVTENFPEDSYHDREFSRRFLSWPRIFQKIPIMTENFPEDSYRDREFSGYRQKRFNTFLTKSMYLSYLLCINKFGLPPSASCPVNRTSTTKSVFLWYRFQRDVHLFLKFRITFTSTKFLEKSLPHNRDFPFTVRNELIVCITGGPRLYCAVLCCAPQCFIALQLVVHGFIEPGSPPIDRLTIMLCLLFRPWQAVNAGTGASRESLTYEQRENVVWGSVRGPRLFLSNNTLRRPNGLLADAREFTPRARIPSYCQLGKLQVHWSEEEEEGNSVTTTTTTTTTSPIMIALKGEIRDLLQSPHCVGNCL